MPETICVILAYYAIGVAVGVHALATSERKPADRLPILGRLGVWAYFVGTSAPFWPVGVSIWVFRHLRKSHSADDDKPHEPINVTFAPDNNGTIQLARVSRAEYVMMAVFLLAPLFFVFGSWIEAPGFTGLFLYFVLFSLVWMSFVGLGVRSRWLERNGVVVINNEIVWTESPFCTPRHFRIPLRDIATVHLVETDPVFFDKGVALVLREESTCAGNLDSGLKQVNAAQMNLDFFGIDISAPSERIIVWPDDKWDWKPENVVAWLEAHGVPRGI